MSTTVMRVLSDNGPDSAPALIRDAGTGHPWLEVDLAARRPASLAGAYRRQCREPDRRLDDRNGPGRLGGPRPGSAAASRVRPRQWPPWSTLADTSANVGTVDARPDGSPPRFDVRRLSCAAPEPRAAFRQRWLEDARKALIPCNLLPRVRPCFPQRTPHCRRESIGPSKPSADGSPWSSGRATPRASRA